MRIEYNVTGAERKELVKKLSEITGEKAKYLYMPTCAYTVGDYTVTKDGAIESDSDANKEELMEQLREAGFEPLDAGEDTQERVETAAEAEDTAEPEETAITEESARDDGDITSEADTTESRADEPAEATAEPQAEDEEGEAMELNIEMAKLKVMRSSHIQQKYDLEREDRKSVV